jgi:hypothetical protein
LLKATSPLASNWASMGPTGGVELDRARLEAAQVRQRHDEADGAVAAHAEVADIVEEDDAELAGLVMRLDEERAHDDVGAARFADDGRAEVVVLLLENLHPLAERSAAQVRTALEHEARRLAAGMGIKDLDVLQ